MAINYIYYPTIQLGPITIYTWGLLVALGFLAGILMSVRYGKKAGFKEDDIYGLCFYLLLGSLVGARLIFVITNLNLYQGDILGVFKVWKGGLDFIGGLVGGTIASLAFVKAKKLRFWKYADLLAPYIALGHAIGRVGCILGDGGHLGKPTNLPWGIAHEGVARHPTALYEMIALIALFIILIKLRSRYKERGAQEGKLFLSYIMGYSILRVGISFLRTDKTYYGLTGTQWGLIIASIAAIILLARMKKGRKEGVEGEIKKEKDTNLKEEKEGVNQEETKEEVSLNEVVK